MSKAQEDLTAYEFVDVFRTLAASVVVVSHTRHLLVVNPIESGAVNKLISSALSLGEEAVLVFFVISGFWIIKSVVGAGVAFSWRQYLSARLTRLWLVAIPAVILGGLMDYLGITTIGGDIYRGIQGANSVTFDVASRLTALNFLGTLAFLQTLLVQPFGSNGPLWSLAFEFWYYIWFPSLWVAVVHRRVSVFLLLTAVVAFAFPGMVSLFFVWCMGGVVLWAANKKAVRDYLGPLGIWPVLIAGVLFVASLAVKHGFELGVLGAYLVGGAFAVLLLTVVSGSFRAPGLLRPLAKFGAHGSYSLYVTHFPLVLLLAAMIVPQTRMAPSPLAWGLVLALAIPAVAYAQVFALLTEHRTADVRRIVALMWKPAAAPSK